MPWQGNNDMWREGVMPTKPGGWELSFVWEPNPDVKGLSWHPTRLRLADSNKPWYHKQVEVGAHPHNSPTSKGFLL